LTIPCTPIDDYQCFSFEAAGSRGKTIRHDVYRRGTGSPVVLIQELPGIGRETLRLADRLVEQGFAVVLPHLFGPLGKTSIAGNTLRVFCMRREFELFARNHSSPIVDWLKALCRQLKNDSGTRGVGVIGMCLTGNFAISLMADDAVLAAVASQPSLPVAIPSALHMSASELSAVTAGIDRNAPIMALRFADDRLCSAEKFAAIDRALNTLSQQRVELKTLPGPGHSVLTIDFVDREGEPTHQALQDVLAYFKRQLQ
jgi:dienelactone hydrolase